ncbi:MAG: DHA2 family efflux MFS transporter permease subunit [Pseudomonadota bacterium]|nr:DHA2 family efflux MFS transporter permease subunit [Pseudomonadota bacterium]
MRETTEVLFERYGPGYRWLAMVAAMSTTITAVLSATIVNVAIPDIMGAFGIDQVRAQWLSTGFLASMTATMLLVDWAIKSFGQRETLLCMLGLFMAGGMLGGFASSEDALILSRVMQGAAAGVIQPMAMVVVYQVFPLEKRGMAMGIYGVGVVMAPAVGPLLGGLLSDGLGWRFVFFAGVPVSLVGILLTSIFIPSGATAETRPRFDWIGFILLLVFLLSTLTAFTDGPRDGWADTFVVGRFIVSATAFVLFIAWERTTDVPMLNLKVFLQPGFVGAAIISFILGAGLFGSTYLIPLFVQTIQGLTPTQSGLLLIPAGISMMCLIPISGRLADRLEPGYIVAFGLILFAFSFFLMSLADVNTSFVTLAIWIMISRMGMGFIFPSLSAGSIRLLPQSMLAQGSSTMNFTRQLGGSFGVNLLAVLLDRQTQYFADLMAATQTPANHATDGYLDKVGELASRAGLSDVQQSLIAMEHLSRAVHAQASTMGFHVSFLASAATFVVALAGAWHLAWGRRTQLRGTA